MVHRNINVRKCACFHGDGAGLLSRIHGTRPLSEAHDKIQGSLVKITAYGLKSALARVVLIAMAGVALASCGSGAVSGSAPVNDPNRITILPNTATLYSGLPTQFVVSGGTGSYIVSSSNQAIVTVSGSLANNTFTVIPSEVANDTEVTLTVRDTGSTPVATATLMVRPGTVGNSITITPSSTQGGSCTPAICSGGDAEVSVQLARGGQPLINRAVRFEVLSGDFRFITSQPGAPIEVSDFTTTTLTDETGRARARLRVGVNANNQTALLRIVDTGSGAFQTSSFTIAQATGSSPGFFASPDTITFSGPNNQECANSGSVDVFVYGGTPPYNVSSVGAPFQVSRDFVSSRGGFFSVLPRGVCVATPGAPITIVDATGRSTVVRVANVLGANSVPALAVAPTTVSLTECNSVASITAAGGNGVYTASSGNSSVYARVVGPNNVIIGRQPNSFPPPQVLVGVGSGNALATVTVNVSGNALGNCDGAPLTVSPTTVTLSSCNRTQVDVTGAVGTVTSNSNNSSVATAPINNNVVYIERAPGSGSFEGPATVFIRDNFSVRTVTVNGNGSGTGACPARP